MRSFVIYLVRIVITLNIICMFAGLVLAMFSIDCLMGDSSMVNFLFGEEASIKFKETRVLYTYTGALAVIVSGISIALAISPTKCALVTLLIVSTCVVLTSLSANLLQLSITSTVSNDLIDVSTFFEKYKLYESEYSEDVHFIQNYFSCCGLYGPEQTYGNITSYPHSCCGLDYKTNNCRRPAMYEKGCQESVRSTIDVDSPILSSITIAVLFMHFFIMCIMIFMLFRFKFVVSALSRKESQEDVEDEQEYK